MPTSTISPFLQAGCPSCRPTNSIKALKAIHVQLQHAIILGSGRAYTVKLSKMSREVGNGSLCLTVNVENPVAPMQRCEPVCEETIDKLLCRGSWTVPPSARPHCSISEMSRPKANAHSSAVQLTYITVLTASSVISL